MFITSMVVEGFACLRCMCFCCSWKSCVQKTWPVWKACGSVSGLCGTASRWPRMIEMHFSHRIRASHSESSCLLVSVISSHSQVFVSIKSANLNHKSWCVIQNSSAVRE